MPNAAPALYDTSTTITSGAARTWIAWNQQHVTLTGAGGGGGTLVVANGGTTTITWTAWNDEYTASSTMPHAPTVSLTGGGGTANTSTVRIWTSWNEEYEGTTPALTNSVTSSNANTWIRWNQTFSTSGVVTRDLQISNEEYQARQRQYAEDSRRREERYRADQLEREEAKARAAVILEENLNAEQRAELAAKQYFTMRSLRPNGEERLYRIHRGRSHNIERVDAAGNKIQRYCMHPIVDCPVEDTMLTQKLWLQNPELEDELLRRANRS